MKNSIIKENQVALAAIFREGDHWKKKLCWKCQKDKRVKNGKLKIWSGGHMFICADCICTAEEKNEPAAQKPRQP